MSHRKAPTSATTANPTKTTPDHSGGRRGRFPCVLCQTSRLWRRPSGRRLAIGRSMDAAEHWHGTTTNTDDGARSGVRLSSSLGRPEPPNPKKVYHPRGGDFRYLPYATSSKARRRKKFAADPYPLKSKGGLPPKIVCPDPLPDYLKGGRPATGGLGE